MNTKLADRPRIFDLIEKNRGAIEAAMPRHLGADRMVRTLLTEIRRVPGLLECHPVTLFGAMVQLSQLGLELGPLLGQAYLIPYKDKVTLIIGYRGMIDLARRSGQVSTITAHVVRDGDEFHYELGSDPKLKHIPRPGRGDVTHAYAVVKLKDGSSQSYVVQRWEIDAARARSASPTKGPWATDFEAMACKTAVRRLFKFMPVSAEIARAVGIDDDEREQSNSFVEAVHGMDLGDLTTPEVQEAPAESPREASAQPGGGRTRSQKIQDALRVAENTDDAPAEQTSEYAQMLANIEACSGEDLEMFIQGMDLSRFTEEERANLNKAAMTKVRQWQQSRPRPSSSVAQNS